MFVRHADDHDRALEERAAVLALAEAAGADAHRAAAAIEAVGSALSLLEGDRNRLDQWETELADELARRVGGVDLERGRAVVVEQLRRGVEVVTVLDAGYPTNLRLAHDIPAALFVRGRLPRARSAVAIVGSRRPTAGGDRRTTELAEVLATQDVVVVSELSRGVAATTLRTAIAAGGQVVAVLGAGIDLRCSPERERLALEVVGPGALVAVSPPGTYPSRRTLRTRAGLLSGLASAVVVVEGAAGTAVAEAAFGQGRPVLFVSGLSAEEAWARRCLSQGLGTVVNSPTEVADRVRCLTEPIDAGIVT
jgi:DNA processing protein